MKKGIALLLAGFMCFSLAGCSSSEPGQTADDGGTSETKISAETKTEEDSSAEETSGSGIDWAEKGAASVKPNPVDENGNSVLAL